MSTNRNQFYTIAMRIIQATAALAWIALLSNSTLFAQAVFGPAANFTLRDSAPVNGTADSMDAIPDGSGFDGYLDVNNVYQEDRVYVEFNMSLLPASWSSTALRFSTASIGSIFPPSTIRLSYYTGNGSADLSDWTIPTTPLATFPDITSDGGQTFIINVTSLTSNVGGSGFLGFRFDLLDSDLNQKALNASSIVLTEAPEPSSTLLGLGGLVALLGRRCRIFFNNKS